MSAPGLAASPVTAPSFGPEEADDAMPPADRQAAPRSTEVMATTTDAAAPGVRVCVRGLAKSYGDARVLTGVDLALAPGSLVAVSGRNGAGKSTLLACLGGILRHEGSVTLDGRPIGRETRGRVAYLPQRLRLPSAASGAEVLRLFSALSAGRGDRVPLPEGFLPDLGRPVGQLSGGQAQRVALAAVLQGGPDLILLDEPFANLDDDARDVAHSVLRAHRDAGATVLVASPTAMDLLAMLDRVLLVEDGGISFDGAPASYASRLEMTVWVRPGAVEPGSVLALPHVLRGRPEGEWLALSCHEDRVVGLLSSLELLGVPASEVRLGGPAADPRHSMSPDPGGGSR